MKFPEMKLSDKLALISSVAASLEAHSEDCMREYSDYKKRSEESISGRDDYYEAEARDYKVRAEIFEFLLSKLSDI